MRFICYSYTDFFSPGLFAVSLYHSSAIDWGDDTLEGYLGQQNCSFIRVQLLYRLAQKD